MNSNCFLPARLAHLAGSLESWGLSSEDWGLRTELQGSSTVAQAPRTEYQGLRTVSHLLRVASCTPIDKILTSRSSAFYNLFQPAVRTVSDTLADLLVLTNSIGPHKPLVRLSQLVPACCEWAKVFQEVLKNLKIAWEKNMKLKLPDVTSLCLVLFQLSLLVNLQICKIMSSTDSIGTGVPGR